MSKKKKNTPIQCQYFRWLLSQKQNGVWQADGRTNKPPCGRQSLGTRDYELAKQRLVELDQKVAVKHGRADKSILNESSEQTLRIDEGCSLFLKHCNRNPVLGGMRTQSIQRYKAVLDKFQNYTTLKRIEYWQQVTKPVLEDYISCLVKPNGKKYAPRTLYFEANTIKRINTWLIEHDLLPEKSKIKLSLKKITGSNTYCWSPEEVTAILEFCEDSPQLKWLSQVLSMLTYTGMRIGEACSLKWSDIDLQNDLVTLKDERSNSRSNSSNSRRTKSGRNRSIPIQPELKQILTQMDFDSQVYVFRGPRGGHLKQDTVRNIFFEDVLKPLSEQFPTPEGEIGFINGRPHSFRHYFCSQCANQNVPIQITQQWLGHADSSMLRIYYHLHDDVSQQQMQKVKFVNKSGSRKRPGKK